MPAKIRLQRVGKKKQPFYRVVVQDKRFARDGKIVEVLGHYDPRKKPTLFEINKEKALKWIKDGVEISQTVRIYLGKLGVMEPVKFKPRKPKPAPAETKKEEKAEKAEEPKAEGPKATAAETETKEVAA